MNNLLTFQTSFFGLFLSILLFALPARGSHLLGGELTFHADTTNTSPLRYFFKLVLYQDNIGFGADTQIATLHFGDGTTKTEVRKSKTILTETPHIARNVFYFEHQFPALGTYNVYFKETNRAIAVMNMLKSENIPWFIQATVFIGLQAAGNRSPVFLAPNIFHGVVGQPFRHNVTAFDADGDSLAIKLVPVLQDVNQTVSSYEFPEGITMNHKTGEISWPLPDKTGRVAIAVEVREYRQNQLIGKVMRDFELFMLPVTNNPVLQIQNRTQLNINTRNQWFITDTSPVKIRVAATNAGNLVAYSELFRLSNVISSQIVADNPREIELTLTPTVSLRRSSPYLITFRATTTSPIILDRLPQQDLTVIVYFRPERATDQQDTTEPSEKVNPTGVPDSEEEAGDAYFQIYPNPVTVGFKIVKKDNKPATLLLYSATSQLVLSQAVNLKQTFIQRSSQIRPGIYFYVIQSEAGKMEKSGKLVFQ